MRLQFQSRRRFSQSPVPVGVEWSNPITRGLGILFDHGQEVTSFARTPNLCTMSMPSSVGTLAAYKAVSTGIGAFFPNSAAVTYVSDSPLAFSGVTSYTLFSYQTATLSSANQSILDADDTSSNRYFQYRINSSNGVQFIAFNTAASTFIASSSAAITAQQAAVGFLMTARVNGTAVTVWRDDIVSPVITLTGTPKGLPPNITVGKNRAGSQAVNNGTLMLWGAYTRALEDGEVKSLAQNPWQLTNYPFRRPSITGGGGGGGGGGAGNSLWFMVT